MGISADKLKALRKQKGFSQEELSKVSGIPVMTIRSWEQGLGHQEIFMLLKDFVMHWRFQ